MFLGIKPSLHLWRNRLANQFMFPSHLFLVLKHRRLKETDVSFWFEFFILFGPLFCLSFNNLKLHKAKGVKNICISSEQPGLELTWARDPIENQRFVNGQIKKTRYLDKLYIWARDMVAWYRSAGFFFDSCQLTTETVNENRAIVHIGWSFLVKNKMCWCCEFFSGFNFHNCLGCVYNCADQSCLHIVQIYGISYIHLHTCSALFLCFLSFVQVFQLILLSVRM